MGQDLQLQVPSDQRAAYLQLFTNHHDVLGQASFDAKATTKILHGASLMDEEPVYVEQSKIPNAHHNAIKCQVASWLRQGLIQPAHNKFNSLLYAIFDPQKGLCILQNFQALNTQPQPDNQSIPEARESIEEIRWPRSTIFSKSKLASRF
jgi:hypothetical protein